MFKYTSNNIHHALGNMLYNVNGFNGGEELSNAVRIRVMEELLAAGDEPRVYVAFSEAMHVFVSEYYTDTMDWVKDNGLYAVYEVRTKRNYAKVEKVNLLFTDY